MIFSSDSQRGTCLWSVADGGGGGGMSYNCISNGRLSIMEQPSEPGYANSVKKSRSGVQRHPQTPFSGASDWEGSNGIKAGMVVIRVQVHFRVLCPTPQLAAPCAR